MGKQKYGSSFEEKLNRRNSESTFKSTPLEDKPRFGSKFEERLNQQQEKGIEALKADEIKTTAHKERTAADHKAYEERINEQQAEASKKAESVLKPEPKKYQAYKPDDSYTRQEQHDAYAEPLRMPDPKDFQFKSYGGAYKQTDSTYGSSTSLNRDFDSLKSETGSLYSHSNSSSDSGFNEPINYGNSGHQKATNATEHQQQSFYQNKNDSAVSVSSHYGEFAAYKGQNSQSFQYKAYSQKQSDTMYDYSAKHETNSYEKDPYSQSYTSQKQDEWVQQGYHNVDSSYQKQQLQLQNAQRKQQNLQAGGYHFAPPPPKPVVRNNTELHDPKLFEANHKIALNRFDGPDMMMKADPKGSPVFVNGYKINPSSEFRVKQGQNIEVDNKLYMLNNEHKLYLFPMMRLRYENYFRMESTILSLNRDRLATVLNWLNCGPSCMMIVLLEPRRFLTP